jgi:hypothetical protein
VPLLFSPIDQEELRNIYPPRPRGAFLMLSLAELVAPGEETMVRIACEALDARRFVAVTAGDVRRTSDFLHKIIDLIRGTGFSIAIFSDRTPAKTLANIFFEIGVALVLGKPVQLVWTARDIGRSAVPSDFVRTEWIRYTVGEEDRLRRELGSAIDAIEQGATYYRQIGDIALDAPEPDLELAFERYKQAILISGNREDRERIEMVRERLMESTRRRRPDPDIASHRTRLLQSVREFVGLLN